MNQRIFDSHLHIIDPAFPLVENKGFLPAPFSVSDYLHRAKSLGVTAGALVSGSFQAFDQTYLLHALKTLGPSFCGVTQLPASTADGEILRLNGKGVRAVRFNLVRGGSESLDQLESFAARVHQLAGWHIELYIDSHDLAELENRLVRLPAVSIDHLGLSQAGFPTLLRLAEKGVRIKATGFGRVDLPVSDALLALYRANPHSLMFGTDLPSTRAPREFAPQDIRLLTETLGEAASRRVLWENAVAFYRLESLNASLSHSG